ncbi:dihydrolipoamide acetyltransferase family protein [Streptomyces sp. NPDC001930]|uniref:dihydrolipoamide acetyltransferase family protein n=1 Tax=Streptomyces sp. NPDC001930 TaxID=3364625 RepID=UPI003680EADB
MPDVGEGLTEAEILKWYVQPGDTVEDGQIVCEVETAKAAVELPIPYDGVVHEVRFDEGTTVDVGAAIIAVATTPPAAAPAGRTPVLVGYGVAESATVRRPRKQPATTPKTAGTPPPTTRPLAKPPVRKLAKDLGVDLTTVIPTGPDGIITRDDIHAVARPAPQPEPEPATEPAAELAAAPAHESGPAPTGADTRETRHPVKGVRRATAAAMVASAFTAPHVTEFVTLDITRTMKLLERLKTDKDLQGLRVNPLLLVARALLVAIKRNPEINATWDEAGRQIVQKHYVNLGIAAATPRGLVVPNIKDAHAKTLPELALSLDELVTTARAGRTTPAALQGGTVTITNIGVFGIDTGTPILNPGESAILAMGAIKLQPWVHKGKVRPRHVTTLALSFDHRLVDGELGSRVLADTAAVLERPQRLIVWS